ncbi:ATP-binding protein [Streptomyces sp. NPDC048637]|uniref:ATP-binding protein n=1 Tax=Streptomyces sp. NPDC048637 TaxID=3155636 RepID=UPI00343DBFD4
MVRADRPSMSATASLSGRRAGNPARTLRGGLRGMGPVVARHAAYPATPRANGPGRGAASRRCSGQGRCSVPTHRTHPSLDLGTSPAAFAAHELALEPQSAGRARRFLLTALSQWNLTPLVDDATLIVSELVANAIRHTRTADGQRIWLALHLLPNELICAATDPIPHPPELLSADATADRGRGLHVVDNLSSSWGWSPAAAPFARPLRRRGRGGCATQSRAPTPRSHTVRPAVNPGAAPGSTLRGRYHRPRSHPGRRGEAGRLARWRPVSM